VLDFVFHTRFVRCVVKCTLMSLAKGRAPCLRGIPSHTQHSKNATFRINQTDSHRYPSRNSVRGDLGLQRLSENSIHQSLTRSRMAGWNSSRACSSSTSHTLTHRAGARRQAFGNPILVTSSRRTRSNCRQSSWHAANALIPSAGDFLNDAAPSATRTSKA